MGSGELSGPGVAMVAAGAFMVYMGLRDVTPLEAMREMAKGRLPQGKPKQSGAAQSAQQALLGSGSGGGVVQVGGGSAVGAGPLPDLVTAARTFSADRYSQARRNQPGYSDCSSFVGKSLRRIGVDPPGISVTTSYLTWSGARRISRAEVGAGDLIVNTGHMIIAVDNQTGIGQQNGRSNVQTGSIESLMSGLPFVCLRVTATRGPDPRAMAV
jgi:cell wall-associated NlpC family hydrolase